MANRLIVSSMTRKLTANLTLSPSQLYVGDLVVQANFYSDVVGLETLESSPSKTVLGHKDTVILELIKKPMLSFAKPESAGLFHNAILYESRGELSKAVMSIATKAPMTFSGTGDHLVSEAFYFNDPEGNGLELYFDRPREQWTWDNGQVRMNTSFIDPNQYLTNHIDESSTDIKQLGHVHLKVGDIDQAKKFYIDILGFDITAQMSGAMFMSVAGYHHHIAVNTWLSRNAAKREMSLGLSKIGIKLDEGHDLDRLRSKLLESNWLFKETKSKIAIVDPWNNQLVFTANR